MLHILPPASTQPQACLWPINPRGLHHWACKGVSALPRLKQLTVIDTPPSGQVLVYSPSSNLERIRACLEAAHTSILPENCSRTIYLLDTQQYACISA